MKYIAVISLILSLNACKNSFQQKGIAANTVIVIPGIIIEHTDTLLRFSNGSYSYKRELFSGTVIERYPNTTIHHERCYWQGREEGIQKMYYGNGAIAEKRAYHLGEKDGVHTGWWPDGKLRFEYHFHNGIYDGSFKEWYSNGRPYKHIHYTAGVDDYGKGWRENGKPYMSYVMKNGRRYGSENANLCYTLKNEAGEFVAAIRPASGK